MGATFRSDAVLTAYAKSLIRFKAKQLSRKPGFTKTDQEDLEQELTAQLLARAHLFDPTRASANTFADRVIKSAIAMMLRDRRRQKRAAGFAAQSLERTFVAQDHGITSLRDALGFADLGRRLGKGDEETRRSELVVAVNQVLESLPPDLQNICRRLISGSLAEVARELEMSRHRLRHAIERIRKHFETAGLGESTGNPDSRRANGIGNEGMAPTSPHGRTP